MPSGLTPASLSPIISFLIKNGPDTGVGLGLGIGVAVGVGTGAGDGVGVGVMAGVGVAVGVGASVGVGFGIGVVAGTGDGVDVGVGAGGVYAGLGADTGVQEETRTETIARIVKTTGARRCSLRQHGSCAKVPTERILAQARSVPATF